MDRYNYMMIGSGTTAMQPASFYYILARGGKERGQKAKPANSKLSSEHGQALTETEMPGRYRRVDIGKEDGKRVKRKKRRKEHTLVRF